ncbi:MAG: hypothetical protein NTX50_11295 [Candidatus Sumerlaeota bacterium]|nr:hypothetical protein [Candidatus Sumerlaeota bacterium]
MILLDEIYNAYKVIDDWLWAQKAPAVVFLSASRKRMAEINDYAFFVLLFGQLEDHINREYEQWVGSWEETAFTHRVNCVFEGDTLRVAIIKNYYEIRCDIAHGHAEEGLVNGRIPLLDVYDFIRAIIT